MAMPHDLMESGALTMDMEVSQIGPRTTLLKNANAAVRLGFVRKVYGLLSMQLLLTVIVAAPFQFLDSVQLQNQTWLIGLSTIATLVCICVMVCCKDVTRTFPLNYVFLSIFTFFEAILVGFVSANFTWQSVMFCAGLTAGIFFGITVFAFKTETDFTGLGPYLFGTLLTFTCWGFILCFFAIIGIPLAWSVMFFDLLGILIFVIYSIYDTQMIMGGQHKTHQFTIDDYVFAALNIYLDIIQLFIHLVKIFGKEK